MVEGRLGVVQANLERPVVFCFVKYAGWWKDGKAEGFFWRERSSRRPEGLYPAQLPVPIQLSLLVMNKKREGECFRSLFHSPPPWIVLLPISTATSPLVHRVVRRLLGLLLHLLVCASFRHGLSFQRTTRKRKRHPCLDIL